MINLKIKNMKNFPILYARNANGAINQWYCIAQDNGILEIHEGLLNGKTTFTTRKCTPKNIGKMNERNAYEQACLEADARIEKKKKQGYKSLEDLKILKYKNLEDVLDVALPINRTDANGLQKPMKAQPYFKDNGDIRISFPCFGQPKLNGFRVFARLEKLTEGEGIFAQEIIKPTFRSKEGLRYTVLEHIEPAIEPIINNIASMLNIAPKDVILDGEMYIHGEILSEISSAVRKRNPKTEKLQFWLFDIAVENIKQDKRLNTLACQTLLNTKSIVGVFRQTINSNEEAQIFTDQCIKQGYEGAIFRDIKAIYQFGKRPQTMVKLKRFQDKEFKIVDVIGGDNSPELGVFICVQEEGKQFKVTPEGSHEVKKEYLANKNKYIGKMLTVRFFERTKDNIPFHSTGVCIRDYEK